MKVEGGDPPSQMFNQKKSSIWNFFLGQWEKFWYNLNDNSRDWDWSQHEKCWPIRYLLLTPFGFNFFNLVFYFTWVGSSSFSDYNLFVIRLFICLSFCISVSLTVYKLFTFFTSSELVNKFQFQFGTKHKWVKGIKVCLNELSSPLSRRDNKKLVNLVAKNQLARKG